ncbi:MAG: DUF4339 domain-containing protein, partial [Muribaculaceae bacterium]|nr:DUF4339 domain-containing protein [Muribaculaceae bacterium]
MKYYIAENGQPAGPFEISELLNHGLTVNSQVWCETMENWQPASQVPELMNVLQPAVQQPYQEPVQQAQPYQGPVQQAQPYQQQAQPYQQPYQQQAQPYQQPYQQQAQPYGGYAQPQYQAPYQVMPKNWLTESILLTVLSVLCCCNPLSLITGIIAIVNANKVKSAYTVGNMPQAEEASKSAKLWTLITLGILLLGFIASALLLMNSPEMSQIFSEAFNK